MKKACPSAPYLLPSFQRQVTVSNLIVSSIVTRGLIRSTHRILLPSLIGEERNALRPEKVCLSSVPPLPDPRLNQLVAIRNGVFDRRMTQPTFPRAPNATQPRTPKPQATLKPQARLGGLGNGPPACKAFLRKCQSARET